jgi:cytochrome c biogenesis protein CcmG/thiol:disulfide interchange protein DsbE
VRASWLRWAIPAAVVPVLVLLAYGFKTNPREIPSPLLDRPAAAFTVTTFAGSPLSLESLRGKVVMLNFWASWCVPACYEQAPALERTWREYKDKGVVVVGIDIQDRDEAAQTFLAEFGHSFPNAPDPAGRIAVDYGVYGVPETFFIDRKGRVRFKQVGALTDELARQRLDTLLKEPS